MAEQELPKLTTRVRFPSPAPLSSISERPFYRHDIVIRKEDGQEMTVVALDRERVVCEWVEREVIIERQTFAPDDLVLVPRG